MQPEQNAQTWAQHASPPAQPVPAGMPAGPDATWPAQASYPGEPAMNQPPPGPAGAPWPAQAPHPGAPAWPTQPATGGAWAAPAAGEVSAAPAGDGAWADPVGGAAWAAPAGDGAWADPVGGAAWAAPAGDGTSTGQMAYPGQQAPAAPAYPPSPEATAAQPSTHWQSQAAHPQQPPARQPASAHEVWPPPSGLWQGQQPGQQMSAPQPAPPGGSQWQVTAQDPPAPPNGGQWQPQAMAQEAPPALPNSGQWQPQAMAQEAPPAPPNGGQWQPQALAQEAPPAPPNGGLWQPQAGPQEARTAASGLWQAQTPEAAAPSGLWQGGPGAQPAQAAPQAAYPAPEPWTPPGQDDAQPWMVRFNSQPPVAPARRRGPWKAVAIGVVALVAVLGAGAGGVNAYARHSVCSTLKGASSALNQGAASSDAAPTDADLAELRKDAGKLRGYGHMLVFSGDLREAVDGLADDEDEMIDLVKSAGTASPTDETAARKALTELVTVAGSVNSHARQAQRACGLPVTGILGD